MRNPKYRERSARPSRSACGRCGLMYRWRIPPTQRTANPKPKDSVGVVIGLRLLDRKRQDSAHLRQEVETGPREMRSTQERAQDGYAMSCYAFLMLAETTAMLTWTNAFVFAF